MILRLDDKGGRIVNVIMNEESKQSRWKSEMKFQLSRKCYCCRRVGAALIMPEPI